MSRIRIKRSRLGPASLVASACPAPRACNAGCGSGGRQRRQFAECRFGSRLVRGGEKLGTGQGVEGRLQILTYDTVGSKLWGLARDRIGDIAVDPLAAWRGRRPTLHRIEELAGHHIGLYAIRRAERLLIRAVGRVFHWTPE